jgi:hypothetical protein
LKKRKNLCSSHEYWRAIKEKIPSQRRKKSKFSVPFESKFSREKCVGQMKRYLKISSIELIGKIKIHPTFLNTTS